MGIKEVGKWIKKGPSKTVETIKKHPKEVSRTIGAGLLVAVVAAAIVPAYYYPRPEGEKIPEISVQTPELGIRFNDDLNTYQIINREGNVIDPADYPYLILGSEITGAGQTKKITTTIKPGEALIIEGYRVGRVTGGVFKTVVANDKPVTVTSDITDGAVTKVDEKDLAIVFVNTVQSAIDRGAAHQNVSIPEGLKAS